MTRNTEGDYEVTDVSLEWRAFDALPPAIREALKHTDSQFSALQCWELKCNGYSTEQILKAIADEDKSYAEEAFLSSFITAESLKEKRT